MATISMSHGLPVIGVERMLDIARGLFASLQSGGAETLKVSTDEARKSLRALASTQQERADGPDVEQDVACHFPPLDQWPVEVRVTHVNARGFE